jgi:hypothetical protein
VLHDHRFSRCHDKQSGLTVPVPEAEQPMLAKLSDFGQIYRSSGSASGFRAGRINARQ